MASYSIRDLSIINLLDRARKDLDELKNKQFVSRRGLATKKTESQLIESESVYFAPADTTRRENLYIEITFHAESQLSPYGRLALEFYDSSGNRLGSESDIRVMTLVDNVTRVDDGILKWSIDVRSFGSGTIGYNKFYTKIIVYGTDNGRISWVNQGGSGSV